MKKWFNSMIADEDGQGMVEYGLLIGLIAIVVIAALLLLGPRIASMFTAVDDALPTTTAAAGG